MICAMDKISLFTIGHSKHPIEKLLGLLKLHGVEIVVDVRSHPMSRFNPQFNRKRLEESLAAEKIEYVFMGNELGGRPQGEQFYDEEGHVLYHRMAQSAGFRMAANEVVMFAGKKNVAIMCSEEDPDHCHRRLLIGKALLDGHTPITLRHIRATGAIQEESASESSPGLQSLESIEADNWKSPKPSSKK